MPWSCRSRLSSGDWPIGRLRNTTCVPARAIIQEAELLADVTALGGRPRQQIAHLAADRLPLSLLVRGDARVDGCPCRKEQLVRLDRVCRLILPRAPPSTALSGSGKPDARAPANDARRPA